MTLRDTIEFMTSDDYQERFIAEYWQTKIRYEKLKKICYQIELFDYHNVESEDMIEYDCPDSLLDQQLDAMRDYLKVLEMRAMVEHIDLENSKPDK